MDQSGVMAWLDDRAWCHPKLARLSDRAHRVWVSGLCYSAGFGTKGRLEDVHQKLIGTTEKAKRELVSIGLWQDVENGAVLIHDWDEHNDKRDAKRATDRERKRRHRERERDTSRNVTRDSERDIERDRRGLKEVKEVKEVTTTTNLTRTPNGVLAQALVGEYVDKVRELGSDPPSRVKGQVARQVGELLSEGQPEDVIRGAIALLVERRLHPSTLPTLLLEATAGPARKRSAKGVSAHEILDMAGKRLGP